MQEIRSWGGSERWWRGEYCVPKEAWMLSWSSMPALYRMLSVKVPKSTFAGIPIITTSQLKSYPFVKVHLKGCIFCKALLEFPDGSNHSFPHILTVPLILSLLYLSICLSIYLSINHVSIIYSVLHSLLGSNIRTMPFSSQSDFHVHLLI